MWDKILNVFSFTGITSVTVWQGVILNSIFIPVVIFLSKSFFTWYNKRKPLQQLLHDYIEYNNHVFIFLAQLSAAFDNWTLNRNQKYVVRYPDPSPTDNARLCYAGRQNIDPVWAEGDGECLANVYNILGRAGKISNIQIAHHIRDWEEWSNPSFLIGFSPKTNKFSEICDPIFYKLTNNELSLGLEGSDVELDSIIPNDAGIIQKTYNKNAGNPVFILAGLGTTGTIGAGHYLMNNCVTLGKLYGKKPFCILLKVRTDHGRQSVVACASYPKPCLHRIFLYPLTYYKFKKCLTS